MPVRLAAEAEARMTDDSGPAPPASEQDSAARQPGARAAPVVTATQIAEAQLRKGLENYRPRQNAPYAELDGYFAVDAARARQIAAGDVELRADFWLSRHSVTCHAPALLEVL